MGFILSLLSFFIGNAKSLFKQPSIDLTQQVVLHLRALTLVLVSTIGSLVLSCVGISLLIASIAGQLDRAEEFRFTGGMTVFSILTVFSLAFLFYSLRRDTWLRSLGFEEKRQAPKQSGALENAVALLVMDFVDERQKKRTDKNDASA
jgi:phosphate/sulfate permease